MRKILVAFGSKYGATAEIAEVIGQTLMDAGLQVDVIPAEQVQDPAPYAAVILGSAVYAGRWREEAVSFLEQHEALLRHRAVWLFSSGPTGEGDPVELMQGWRFPEAQRPLADRIGPRDIAFFHGLIDPDRLSLGERLLVRALRAPTGDFRDWEGICNWAGEIARALSEERTPRKERLL